MLSQMVSPSRTTSFTYFDVDIVCNVSLLKAEILIALLLAAFPSQYVMHNRHLVKIC